MGLPGAVVDPDQLADEPHHSHLMAQTLGSARIATLHLTKIARTSYPMNLMNYDFISVDDLFHDG
jgi:hypothetical protein